MSRRISTKSAPRNVPPELDFTSESFDPVKVLDAESLCLPFPNAKTYNNLAEYYSHTFLKKEVRENNRGSKEATRERNYAWYYSTMGYDPSLGNEYYADLYRKQNKIKRRKGKKPASTTTTVCENFRTNKVTKLKSKYKLYCQRKFNKWKREIASKQSNAAVAATATSSVDDVWTLTSNYAKEFNPASTVLASTSVEDDFSMNPMSTLENFLANVMETSDLRTSSTLLPVGNTEPLSSDNRKVLLKLDNNSDPFSFLKCILFGKVDISRQQSFGSDTNLTRIKTGETMCLPGKLSLPLVPSHDIARNVESSHFLSVDLLSAGNKNDNSAYETESSGYMSDCSEVERSTKRLKGVVSKNRDLNLMQTKQSETVNKSNGQTGVSNNRKALKCKGNNVSCEMLPKEREKNAKEHSIVVKIDRKLIKVEDGKNTKKSANGCVCDIKSSKELSCQCVCGFYNKAMNAMRKFKIPRKKSVQSDSNKKKRKLV